MKEVPKHDVPEVSGGLRPEDGLVIPGWPAPGQYPQFPMAPCPTIDDPTTDNLK